MTTATQSEETQALGAEIDAIHALKREKAGLEAKVNEVEKKIKDAEYKLLLRMDDETLRNAAGACARAVVSESVYPSAKNWDEFYDYVHRNRYYHLFQRRLAVEACNEIFEREGRIPGVEPYTKRVVKISPL